MDNEELTRIEGEIILGEDDNELKVVSVSLVKKLGS
jgi:hypothetical protein